MSRLRLDIIIATAVAAIGWVVTFVFKAVFASEVEEFWNGIVQPFLVDVGLQRGISIIEFISTFWGGVIFAFFILIVADLVRERSWGWRHNRSHSTRWDPSQAMTLSEAINNNFPPLITNKLRADYRAYLDGSLPAKERAEYDELRLHRQHCISRLFAVGELLGFGNDPSGKWVEIPRKFWKIDTHIDGMGEKVSRAGYSYSKVKVMKP